MDRSTEFVEVEPVTLEVDTQESDSDSKPGRSIDSSSSLYESVEQNGRKCHKFKAGNYYLPNDEFEQNRLDIQHHLFLLTLNGKLSLAPILNPARVLDIGTGTGIWAIEYATQNPSSMVVGTDLSPIQPNLVPPNCHFEVADAEDEWDTLGHEFSYIHGRALFTCFKNPVAVFQKAYDALAPGGYFEMQDIYFKPHSLDGTVDNTALAKWNEQLIHCAVVLGRNWHCAPHYAQWFRDIGFEDVTEIQLKWPGNSWPKGERQKTMGMLMLTNGLDGLSAVSMTAMTRTLGMSMDQVEESLVDVRRDMRDESIHTYYPIYVVYGRKHL